MSRNVIAGLAAIAFTAAACAPAHTQPPSSPSVTTSVQASAGPTDEDRILELLKQEEAALAAWDFERAIELKCAKYREDARAELEAAIPPIAQFGTPDDLAAKAPANLVAVLKTKLPNASDPSLDRLANALIRYDEPAYRDAMLQLLRETVRVTVDRVENIAVNGDSATADVTLTTISPTQPPETATEPNVFVRENGQWKDCEPPTD